MPRSSDDDDDDFDDVDRGILHALQIDARAPFRRIGEVLGVSDQTVARRYGRLRDRRVVRVVGRVHHAVVDVAQWLFHVHATPEAGADLAEGLAARPDTSWVARCGGPGRIVGTVYGTDAEALLLEVLPRSRHVVDVRAERVLQVVYGGAGQPFAKAGALGAEQVAALARHVPPVTDAPAPFDAVDHRILAVLRGDGRAGVDRLVGATGASAATVRRRLQALRAGGALAFDVDVDMRLVDLTVRVLLHARIAPAQVAEAGRQLAEHTEVGFAAVTTGRDNVFASVSVRDAGALSAYLTERAGTLPGLQALATTPVLRTVKAESTRYGARLDGPRAP